MNESVSISEETLQDIINIETGVLSPLDGFMREEDFRSVVDSYTMSNGDVFTLPITIDVTKELYDNLDVCSQIDLYFDGQAVATMDVESKYIISSEDIVKVFGTKDKAHPGVKKEIEKEPFRIGGKTHVLNNIFLEDALTPEKTRKAFKDRGWDTVIGFQTRNPIHKAHEYIQRLGLETCDGLFINPITGWKKRGDFSEEAVMAAYSAMIRDFYPSGRVYLVGLKTQMRYAGPREAIFHAIIRRNLGCTHFIIGRDHAGVGGYYGAYDAHMLAREISDNNDIGIHLLLTREPYYCNKCKQIVTDRTCSHYYTDRLEISGTIIRKYINDGYIPDEKMMRKEVFEAILKCGDIFIK